MRVRVILAAAVVVALAAAAPSLGADRMVERGIVQSIDSSAVVIRALDGTTVTVPLGAETRYRLNGRAATFAEIRPGFVAEVASGGSGAAIVLRAFGRVERPVERGSIARVSPRALLLRRGPGDTVRLAITGRTVVWRGGSKAPLRALRAGMRVQVTLAGNGSARVILVRRAAA